PTTANIPAPSPLPAHAKKAKPGRRLALIAAASFFGVLVLVLGGLGIRAAASRGGVEEAVVRVVTAHGQGTGFFVEGPDDHAYVATAFHVVESGDGILVERSVAGEDGRFTEAYPDVEVVAVDADADLAVLRIPHLGKGRFPHLEIGDEPTVNEEVKAYGFPQSGLTRQTGLIAKDGKLLSTVKFPVYDLRLARVVKENAVEGLLVSVDVEPGFSGGPTLNDDGEVIGITVTKDRVHRGQNGAVVATRLKTLLERVTPLAEREAPTPAAVAELLAKVQQDVLLLATKERLEAREHDYIAATELPHLRSLIDAFRRHERDSTVAPGATLSGRAALGMWAAQMAGEPLSTYRSRDVQEALRVCENQSAPMQGFLGATPVQTTPGAMRGCDAIALRPLAWDLLAATLQWAGEERSFEVTKLERADEESDVYQAMVRVSGLDELLPLWVSVDYGELRIKLFDKEGKLYGVRQAGQTSARDFVGTWRRVEPRAPSPSLDNTERETTEEVTLSESGGRVTVKHHVARTLYAQSGKRFRCNARAEVKGELQQSFAGEVDHGVVVGSPIDPAKNGGRDGSHCNWGYVPDAMVAFKRVGDKLVMVRTDGSQYPQSIELERVAAAPVAGLAD
ncbi:MAG: trypsin-like peptidase domain-containing protein, partial [Myxococcales bacterium]|nr:trypsin-like peptidase domain-containing protein [Myxococcales bacterium]